MRFAVWVGISLVVWATDTSFAREWVDSTGKHRIEAEMVSSMDGTVWLKKPGGTVISIPLDRLSVIDRAYVRNHPSGPEPDVASKPAAKPNPDPNPAPTARIQLPDVSRPFGAPPATPNMQSGNLPRPAMPSPLSNDAQFAGTVTIQNGNLTCTGFVVDPAGVVVTTSYIVSTNRQPIVRFADGTSMKAMGCLGVDLSRGIAVLKVNAPGQLTSLVVSNQVIKKGRVVGFAGGRNRTLVTEIGPLYQLPALRGKPVDRQLAGDTIAFHAAFPSFRQYWGSPVFDQDGQVVGMVIRAHDLEPQSCVAIASDCIVNIVDSCYRQVAQHLSAFHRGDRSSAPTPFPPVRLPSGESFSLEKVGVPEEWPECGIEIGAGLCPLDTRAGRPKSLHAFFNGKLHGPSIYLDEQGSRQWAAEFAEGERSGRVWAWNAQGGMELFAEYDQNGKSGVVCLFREGRPSLVQQWSRNRMLSEYLVDWRTGQPTVHSAEQISGGALIRLAAKSRERLVDLERELREQEAVAREGVAKWYRAVARGVRRR